MSGCMYGFGDDRRGCVCPVEVGVGELDHTEYIGSDNWA